MRRDKVTLAFTVEVWDCPKDEAQFLIDGIKDAVAMGGFEADVFRREPRDPNPGLHHNGGRSEL